MKKLLKQLIPIVFCLSLVGCNNKGEYKLSVQDLNNIILNKTDICNSSETYGFYHAGDTITFDIKFFSGLSASLLIDGEYYHPTATEAFEPQYISYKMPNHDVSVVSLINGYAGDEIKLCETLDWGSNINDENLDYIDVQIKYLGVAPGKENGETARIYDDGHSISFWFNNAMIREQDYDIDGGCGYTITFTLKDKTSYTLNIKNNYLFENGKTYYISSGLPYAIESSFREAPGGRYEISYVDGLKPYLLEDNPAFGVPGEIVEIRTSIIYDANLILHATFSDHFNQILYYESIDDYWLFSFTMPGCPVTISYDIVGGM